MTPDHYATLGLAPSSHDVVIRAAYVALMRLYHPDRNPSAEAATQTSAINDAYAVLGDPERRAEYDKIRIEAAWVPDPPVKPRSPTALFAAAAMTLLALAVFLFIRAPLPSTDRPFGIPETGEELAALEPGPPPAILDPRSGLRQTPDAVLRAGQPSAQPQLPLPPPMARVASRPAPPPPAAPAAAPAPAQPRSAPTPVAQPKVAPAPARVARAAVQPAPMPPRPSFSCRFARTRGEIAVCRNANLAALDRQQALLYSQSWGRADNGRRKKLLRTHQKFVNRRDGCRSDACTSAVYVARLREVSAIMTR